MEARTRDSYTCRRVIVFPVCARERMHGIRMEKIRVTKMNQQNSDSFVTWLHVAQIVWMEFSPQNPRVQCSDAVTTYTSWQWNSKRMQS